MTRTRKERIAAAVILTVALLFIAAGLAHSHKVYDAEAEDFGLIGFTRVKDYGLVVDATFSGTVNRDGKLYSTYDRSEPRGKRSCPT